jgi:predicted small lipoprotein YifL
MSNTRNEARWSILGAMLICLTGCGGGGSSDTPPAQANEPPPAPPPPPPPAPDPVPPLSSVVVNLDDNHAVGAVHWSDGNTAAGGQGQVVQGLECLPSMIETYHVHTHVSIFLDGVALAFPADIGIAPLQPSGRCFYSIHTHDLSGKIHVEGPAPGTFTLGQLFAIWGQPLETTDVAGLTGKPIVVYSTEQSTVTRVSGDWKAIELTSHKEITIQIGTPIAEIPNFTWSAN